VIFKGSRYEKLAKAAMTVTGSDGQKHPVLPIRFVPAAPAVVRYLMTDHDRLDLLAYHYYGDPQKFWLICDANQAMDPEELLRSGLSIFVPPDRNL